MAVFTATKKNVVKDFEFYAGMLFNCLGVDSRLPYSRVFTVTSIKS